MLDALADRVRPTVRWGINHALPRTLMAVESRRGDLEGRLIMQDSTAPAAELDALIEEIHDAGALSRTRVGYLTATHSVVKEVLTSNDFRTGVDVSAVEGPVGRIARWAGTGTPLGPLTPPSLLVTEPPQHTRYRKLVSRVFTVRAVERLRTRAEQVAVELLDSMDPTGSSELVSAYCAQLPVTLIAEILGVAVEDRHRVLEFGGGAAPSLDVGLGFVEFRGVERALRNFEHWLDGHLEELRADPGEDLMSQLVLARQDGVGLSNAELKATAGLVLAAGFETTVNLLGNGIRLLHDHPDQLALLRARPDLWANAVDEVLRLDPPVLLTGRVARRDTELAGVPVARGSFVTTVLAGANRDPAVFDDPGGFDVSRDQRARPPRLLLRTPLLPRRGAGPDGGRGRLARLLRPLPRRPPAAGGTAAYHPDPARVRRPSRRPHRCSSSEPRRARREPVSHPLAPIRRGPTTIGCPAYAAPIVVRRARPDGRSPRRLSSVGRASHS